MNIKKKISIGILTIIIATTTYISSALAYVPIGENYHIPSIKIEIDNFWEKEAQALQRSKYLELNIQAPLIKYNPHKVWKAKTKYDDGLKEVYIYPKGTSTDSDVGGSNYGGGYISLTRGSILVNSAPRYGSSDTTLTPKDYNIYALSAIASDYAHECGHWYYNDPLTSVKLGQSKETADRDMIPQEARADAFGIRLLENVPQFSVGGDMISVRRMAKQSSWYGNQKEHPTHDSRWKNTYNYIKQMSNCRVYFEDETSHENNTFYIKDKQGKDWGIVVPPQYDVDGFVDAYNKKELYSSYERANYVMGQVAWAIKNNCWDANHVSIDEGTKYFKDIPQGDVTIKVIVARKNNKEYKIIDWGGTSTVENKNFYTPEQKEAFDNYLSNLLSNAGKKTPPSKRSEGWR